MQLLGDAPQRAERVPVTTSQQETGRINATILPGMREKHEPEIELYDDDMFVELGIDDNGDSVQKPKETKRTAI